MIELIAWIGGIGQRVFSPLRLTPQRDIKRGALIWLSGGGVRIDLSDKQVQAAIRRHMQALAKIKVS